MKPYTTNKSIKVEANEDTITRTTTIKETRYLNKNLKVPVKASIHPAGLRELAVLSPTTVLRLGIYLPSLLYEVEQNNIVAVTQEELAKVLFVSPKSINSALKVLESHKFIQKQGNSLYYISPKLAWFNTQATWATELNKLKQNKELGQDYYSKDEPIESYTITTSPPWDITNKRTD